jgi:hypothetical protein
MQLEGLTGQASNGDGAAPNGSLSDQIVNSALRYRAQAPLLEGLLKELGIDGAHINGLTMPLQTNSPTQGSEGVQEQALGDTGLSK